MKQHIILLLLSATLMALTGCRSSQKAAKQPSLPGQGTTETTRVDNAQKAAVAYVNRVAEVKAQKPCITASAKVRLEGFGKDVSLSGKLSMKRNDVVRLSLRALGFEVGLMEFTPQDVLVVDRINKQYVRASYAEVSFLKQANLDFYSLQALFWNELFVPGKQQPSTADAARFHVSEAEGHKLLALTDTPKLSYTFRTLPAEGLIDRLLVKGRAAADRGQFVWTYGDFAAFAGRRFPKEMEMKVSGTGKDLTLGLSLSNLKNDSDWNTRTSLSAKYTRRSLQEVMKGLNL